MFVKIVKQGGSRVEEVYVDDGATVGDALDIAGIDPTGYNIRLNRVDVTVDTVLNNGADATNVITLLQAIKGGK